MIGPYSPSYSSFKIVPRLANVGKYKQEIRPPSCIVRPPQTFTMDGRIPEIPVAASIVSRPNLSCERCKR
jgi:hypothetical protein